VAVLARDVGKLLKMKGLTIAVAESCTGGRLGDALTNVSGSSDYFVGGVVSYSNRAKIDLLEVHESTLILKGAVSDEVARQMASGTRNALHATIGVGITGVAGPTGGTPRKPVGMVYIAVNSAKGTTSSKNLFKGSRTRVKQQAVDKALKMVVHFVKQKY
jgi:PncC family amidohydrolase